MAVDNKHKEIRETTYSRWDAGSDMYKVFVSEVTLHNRSGKFPMKAMQFVIPIHRDLLEAISKYCGLEQFK
jgi:hypothetical protein